MKMNKNWIFFLIAVFAVIAWAAGLVSSEAAMLAPFVPVIGSALTEDRDTKSRQGESYSIGVAANAKLYMGGIGAINSSGYAVPASDAAGLRVVGRIQEQVDNTGGANGAKSVLMTAGVYKFAGTGLTVVDVGKQCFIVDDQTISLAATTNNVFAGVIEAIDSATEAWVRTGMAQAVPVKKNRLSYKSVAVTVNAAATEGSSAADADLVGGEIFGGPCPTGNQDQFVDNVVLNVDGSITVTLAAAATANNTFKVVVLRNI